MFFDEKLTELAAMMTISSTMAHAAGLERRSNLDEKADQSDRQQDGVDEAELDDGGNPEVFDAVVEAELRLQRIHPNRVGAEDQFMPIEMREQAEGGVTRQRAALVGREAQQHLVENAEVKRGEDDGAGGKQHADREDRGGKRHSLSPLSRRIASNSPTSPIIASTVTSDVRPPKAISDPRLNAISGSRSSSGGQIAGRSTSAST
jgi:hypothetical protein